MKKSSLFFLLFLYVGCSSNVATVGKQGITEKNINDRVKVLEILEPQRANRTAALADLVKSDLILEIINSMGYGISTKDLEEESKRLEGGFNPDTLNKIRDVFGSDTKSYLDTFVAVLFHDRVLIQGIFISSEDIHADRRETAQKLLAAAKESGKSLEEIAGPMGLRASKFKLSPKSGFVSHSKVQFAQPLGVKSKQTQTVLNAVKTLKNNEVYPKLIPWVQGYQVIKFITKENDYYVVESVMVNKHNYDDWFREKAANIPVSVKDNKLKDDFLKETPWAGNLKLS